jgi:predicted amidohydrolase YtcJ
VSAKLILHNAKIATNGVPSFVEAIAITAGRISAAGKDEEIVRLRDPQTRVIDGRQRTVIPGLNDSHMHPIRGGLNYNLELRWDGIPSLADALKTGGWLAKLREMIPSYGQSLIENPALCERGRAATAEVLNIVNFNVKEIKK